MVWTSASSHRLIEPSPHYNPSEVCHRAGVVAEGVGCGSCEDAIGDYKAIVR